MFVHGNNLAEKEAHTKKYMDKRSRAQLKEIRAEYNLWKKSNLSLKGPFKELRSPDIEVIKQRVGWLNHYKDFIDQQHYAEQFDSRSNLHSTVLEEFMYYLFKDLVEELSKFALVGKSHTFKDIFFAPQSFEEMLKTPNARIERKDHDFAIGVQVHSTLLCEGAKISEDSVWDLPAVAIECKTYLDKTMLQDASTAAEQLKVRNPNAMYLVVAEWLKLTDAVNMKKFKIDQVYILRKQKNTDREYRYEADYKKNPIYEDIVWHLFSSVREYLTIPWTGGTEYGLDRGYLL